LVKGADWRGKTVAGQTMVESSGGRVEFIELELGLSTTSIIEKMKNT
jgi:D-beta-D-heptose 7-phosphate kinase/D-beta-D-heptose 1-phosphate adenosyltransferase